VGGVGWGGGGVRQGGWQQWDGDVVRGFTEGRQGWGGVCVWGGQWWRVMTIDQVSQQSKKKCSNTRQKCLACSAFLYPGGRLSVLPQLSSGLRPWRMQRRQPRSGWVSDVMHVISLNLVGQREARRQRLLIALVVWALQQELVEPTE
jgi:hypothetical protein